MMREEIQVGLHFIAGYIDVSEWENRVLFAGWLDNPGLQFPGTLSYHCLSVCIPAHSYIH